jgi:hypothetical protein
MENRTISPPVGASVWERDLYQHLIEHTNTEGAMLDQYAEAANTSESRALAYVIGLLFEDELRHHRHFDDLAASLKSDAELSGADPVIPRLDFESVDSQELRSLTKRLLTHEKADISELKRLRKNLNTVEDTTLWGLLVEIMTYDTKKHIAILRWVENHIPK